MIFEDLEAWKEARKLVNSIYLMTQDGKISKDFGLCGQIQRAAVSAMTNVAEGFERTGHAEKINFYNIARASCGEVRSLLYVVEDNYKASAPEVIELRNQCASTGKLISGLIASTRRRSAAKGVAIILVFVGILHFVGSVA